MAKQILIDWQNDGLSNDIEKMKIAIKDKKSFGKKKRNRKKNKKKKDGKRAAEKVRIKRERKNRKNKARRQHEKSQSLDPKFKKKPFRLTLMLVFHPRGFPVQQTDARRRKR